MRNKNHIRNRIFQLILATIISISTLLPLPVYGEAGEDTPIDLVYFIQIMDLVKNNYVHDIGEEQLIQGSIKGLFYYLDENSDYYTKEEFHQLLEDISGDFVGIGIFIKEEDGQIIITEPIKDGPAYKAGIRSGDMILAVDGQDIRGLSTKEVVDLIKGEANTKVNIKVQRGKGEPKDYTLTRESIRIKTVEYKKINGDIGYIRLSQFSQYSQGEIKDALNKLDKENISSIILDLRGNPGGLLDEAVDISRLFIPEGPIVHIKYKDNMVTYYSTLKKPKYKLVVLVDENSASASEILAGAVQDRKAGTVVGVPTYGKGTVQQIVSLPKGDGIKLTIAEYLTPNKRNINGKGITPDIIVENKDGGKDAQLQKAIDLLTK